MKTTLSLVKSILVATSVVAIGTMSANSASAATFNFGNIAGGDTVGNAYAPNFSLTVTDAGANSVLFKIFNNGNVAAPSMFISTVYFDRGANTSILSGLGLNQGNQGIVNFVSNGAANLPQGNNAGFSTDFSATRVTGGGNRFGIQGGEALGILFAGNYNSVVSALANNSLRVGLHVQALPGGASDSYISEVPEPTTMLGSALALGLFAKMKKRAKNA